MNIHLPLSYFYVSPKCPELWDEQSKSQYCEIFFTPGVAVLWSKVDFVFSIK